MEELIIKEREFRMGLVSLVNNSNLPAFIMKSTFLRKKMVGTFPNGKSQRIIFLRNCRKG